MALLSITHSFFPGTLAKSSEVNTNFADIVGWSAGGLGNDSLSTLEGPLDWAITTNVKAVDISNSGNEGSINVLSQTALGAGKSVFKVTSDAAETAGDALVYIKSTSLGSTIPALRVDYANSQAFVVGASGVVVPARTRAAETALVSPAAGSILFIEELSGTQHEGLRYYSGSSWSAVGMPTGSMIQFAGSTAPAGFLVCDGSEVGQATYPQLYAALGTTWGAAAPGFFKLPDLRRRITIGSGGTFAQGPAITLGSYGGDQELQNHTHTATTTSAGDHNHGLTPGFEGAPGMTQSPGGIGDRVFNTNSNAAPGTHPGLTSSNGSHTHPVIVNTGGTGSGGNYPPTAVMNTLIKW